MTVVFYLKGAVRIDWRVPDPSAFNFQGMVKLIRADGQFLADGLYVQASEIAAIVYMHDESERDEDVAVHHRGRVERLAS